MYYVLGSPSYPCRWMGEEPRTPGFKWRQGSAQSAPIPSPLDFRLKPLNRDADDHGPTLPPYFLGNLLLLRDDLLETLRTGGANNLDAYDARIVDPDGGEPITDYKAINVIGLVAAADMQASKATIHPGGPVIDVDFDELVVDPKRAHGLLVFRLAESTTTILFHEKLVRHVRASGFEKTVQFFEPSEVAL